MALLKEIKEVRRERLTAYKNARLTTEYNKGRGVWQIKSALALPSAPQKELTLEDGNTVEENGILFIPGKASNCGGVATSALEMSQNSERLSWSFEEVDSKLKGIMENVYANISAAAKKYGMEGNYVACANIAGFEKVLDAMNAQGIV